MSAEELKEKLFKKTNTGWEELGEEKRTNLFNYAKGYIN